MSEEHYRAQQTLLVRGHDLAALQADLKTFSNKRQGSFTLDENEQIQAVRLPRLIIHPLDRVYQAWSDFLLIWVLYTAFVGPFEFAFMPKNQGLGLTISDSVVDFFFFCDLVITFFVAYYDKETAQLIVDRNRIAVKYLRSFFLLDLLSCIPFRTALHGVSSETSTHLMFRILGLLRLWRLRRLSRVFSKLEKNVRINYFWTRTVKFFVVIMLAGHFAGCFFYFLATTYPVASQGYTWIGENTNDFRADHLYRRYITSLYFAIVTLTTVGYGDYSPQSVREITFAIFYIIFSMGLTAYVIGNITALIQKTSARTLQYREELKDLHTYCVYNNLPSGLRQEMLDFMQLKFRISEKRRDVLDKFPRPIRARVAKLLHRSYLEGADLFQDCSPEMLEQMEADMEVEYFMPNDILIAQKDIHPQLYILTAGIVELSITELGESRVIGIWKPGMSVGDVALLCNIPQPFTCKAFALCRVLTIKRQIFKELLQSFPQDAQQMANNLLKRMRNEGDHHLNLLANEVAALVGKKEEELVLQLCAAAAHGDLRSLRQLMQSGIDPNVGDFDGRRALHVAAAMGYDDCVRFLISGGADVNVKDKFNCSPLSEALRLGQQSTAELLQEHGADITPRVAAYDLCTAIADGNVRHVDLLLRFGADPDCWDYDGKTALQIATTLGHEEIVRLLIIYGARTKADPPLANEHNGEVPTSFDALEELRNVDGPSTSTGPTLLHVGSMRHLVHSSVENGAKSEPSDGTPIPATANGHCTAEKPSHSNGQKATAGNPDRKPDPDPEPESPGIDVEDYLRRQASGNVGREAPNTPLAHPTPIRARNSALTILTDLRPTTSNLSSLTSGTSDPVRAPENPPNRTSPPVPPTTRPPLPSPTHHRTPLSSPQLSLRGSDTDVPTRYREKESDGRRSPEVVPLVQAAHRARSEAQESQPGRGPETRRITVHPVEDPGGGTRAGGLVVALGGLTMGGLLGIAETEFGYVATRLLDKDGAEIRNVKLLRDGDHVYLASAGAAQQRQPSHTAILDQRLGELQELLVSLQSEVRDSKQ